MVKNTVLILDGGSRYKELLARKVREQGVYSEIRPATLAASEIAGQGYAALILAGGMVDVDPEILELGLPLLAVGKGAKALLEAAGGKAATGEKDCAEAELLLDEEALLFKGLGKTVSLQKNRSFGIEKLPEGFAVSARQGGLPVAAENQEKKQYLLFFHPERSSAEGGEKMLANFLFEAAGLEADWTAKSYIEHELVHIKEQVGDHKVLCALSGGVDSSVAAVMVHRVVGDNLHCIFVDHGLMRKNEGDMVEKVFRSFDINFTRVDAEDRFLGKLAGVTDPERKRKIIGEEFIRVFEEQALQFKDCDYLVQGTIYPDVVESGVGGQVVKSHHNVGGLPEDIHFKGIVEPLRSLFKNEVRAVGLELGLPPEMVWRQPFPGPGLAIRCLGEVRKDRLDILRDADAIFREEVKNFGLEKELGQYFAVLTDLRSVGVKQDARSYDYTLALRAVKTTDFMTAEWAKLPYELLDRCSSRIIAEVPGINRVVYDITGKPPATIEWE